MACARRFPKALNQLRLLLITACVVVACPTLAQQSSETTKAKPVFSSTSFDGLTNAEQDSVRIETTEVQQYCSQKLILRDYYDCACFADRFQDQRLSEGPGASRNAILQQMSSQPPIDCVDQDSIRAHHYETCMPQATMGLVTEPFCACTSREIARRYAARPTMNLTYITKELAGQAGIACTSQLAQTAAPAVPTFTTESATTSETTGSSDQSVVTGSARDCMKSRRSGRSHGQVSFNACQETVRILAWVTPSQCNPTKLPSGTQYVMHLPDLTRAHGTYEVCYLGEPGCSC